MTAQARPTSPRIPRRCCESLARCVPWRASRRWGTCERETGAPYRQDKCSRATAEQERQPRTSSNQSATKQQSSKSNNRARAAGVRTLEWQLHKFRLRGWLILRGTPEAPARFRPVPPIRPIADFWAECLGPAELVGGSVDVPQSRRSRRSRASQGQAGERLSFEEPRENSGKRKMAYKVKCLAQVTGKACSCCSKKDSDPDPVVPTTPCLLGDYRWTTEADRIASAELATNGATCWYCMKAFVT